VAETTIKRKKQQCQDDACVVAESLKGSQKEDRQDDWTLDQKKRKRQ